MMSWLLWLSSVSVITNKKGLILRTLEPGFATKATLNEERNLREENTRFKSRRRLGNDVPKAFQDQS